MKNILLLTLAPCLLFFEASAMSLAQNSDTLLLYYFPNQCDSLIQANATNPNFVVMDVRTPAEYNPDHLEGAINRDFYASDFNARIDSLPRQKIYLLYCSGGSRSMNTFNLMDSMGFTQLVDMLGGIVAWKSASLPTTSDFAPLQMAVSDTVVANDTVNIGTIDTIQLTVTNRGNDMLHFTGITTLTGTEFTTDFDQDTTIEGPFDYTFSVFYTPVDEQPDSVCLLIQSNGGNVRFYISRTGKIPLSVSAERPVPDWNIYPNPFSTSVTIEYNLVAAGNVEIVVYSHFGQVIDHVIQSNGQKGKNRILCDTESLTPGVYYCRFMSGKQVSETKMVKW